jgi:hypothetical protein
MTLKRRLAALEGKAGTAGQPGPSILVIQAVTKSGKTGEDMTLMVRRASGAWQHFHREPGEDQAAFHSRAEAGASYILPHNGRESL